MCTWEECILMHLTYEELELIICCISGVMSHLIHCTSLIFFWMVYPLKCKRHVKVPYYVSTDINKLKGESKNGAYHMPSISKAGWRHKKWFPHQLPHFQGASQLLLLASGKVYEIRNYSGFWIKWACVKAIWEWIFHFLYCIFLHWFLKLVVLGTWAWIWLWLATAVVGSMVRLYLYASCLHHCSPFILCFRGTAHPFPRKLFNR